MERITCLYKKLRSYGPDSIVPLSAAGSNRQYFRLSHDTETLIAVIGTSKEENDAFVSLANAFSTVGLPVPSVLAVSDDGMVYLQDDLGDQSLYAAIAAGRERGGGHTGKGKCFSSH